MHFRENTLFFDVLLVDDDPAVLNLLTHLLEMGHHRVRSASDGNQAIQLILQHCPDVLIANRHLPGLGGLELCRRVRQLHSRKVLPHYTYILLLTGQSDKDITVEGLEAGVDDFIEKNIASLSSFRVEIQAKFNAAQRIRKLEVDLEFAAKYDALTRLLNRVAFFEAAQTQWERSIKNKAPLAAVMMDCDFFKRVNDIYGHAAGDTVLSEFAAVLRNFSRHTDIVGRYGGEEFCAILPGCNEADAWDWAERIRRQCEEIPVKHADLEIPVTISFGIAERTETTALFDHLMDRADQSLLAAKQWGRNRCISYSQLLEDISSDTGHFVAELFAGATAADVMVPFPLSIKPYDSAATAADYFLKTRLETLPITDHEGTLIGVVSETDLIAMLGQLERWTAPVKNSVFPNIASYPADTPIRKIIDFLNRTSVRWIMIVQGDKLLGYINRTLLLRWLRNQWAMRSGLCRDIIPNLPSRADLASNLHDAIGVLKKELDTLDTYCPELFTTERCRIVSAISQCQYEIDEVLIYGSLAAR
ncbi:MAG: diguanylate cyclase [Planctomycetaceae bacterium]|nr:diguanylate cyclase [Planctomycetaceae bacterium]